MGRPGEDGRDLEHRDDFEKEEEEELDDDLDQYDDLIGGAADNAGTAVTAAAVRAHRGTDDVEQDQLDDMFEALDLREFIGSPPAGDAKAQTTADEPEDEEPPPLAAPAEPDEDEGEGALPAQNEMWAGAFMGAPAPSELFIGSSDWVKPETDGD